MNPKTYYSITGAIFLIIAILHLLRVFSAWDAQIGTFVVPMWFSWIGLLVAGFLAYQGLKRKG